MTTLSTKLAGLRESFDLAHRGKRGGKFPNKSVTDALVRVAIEADRVYKREHPSLRNALAALEEALEEQE